MKFRPSKFPQRSTDFPRSFVKNSRVRRRSVRKQIKQLEMLGLSRKHLFSNNKIRF